MNTPPVNGMPPVAAGGTSPRTRREQRNLLLAVAALLIFGGVCWFAFPHVSRLTRQWLGRRHLPELRQQIKDQKWREAAEAMRDARRWAPADPEVIRAGLEFVNAIGGDPRNTIALIRQLQETGAATPVELALLGKMHARIGETSKAREIHGRLPQETRQTPDGMELEAALLLADGHDEAAGQLLREALLHRPEDEGSLRQLAAMDLSSTDPSRRKAMRERLWRVAGDGTPLSLTAVELLSQTKDLTVPQVAELQQVVDGATSTVRETVGLRVLSARMRLSPQLRNELIDQELLRWKNHTPAQTEPLVTWLADEHEYARILRMLPVQTASRYTDLLPAYVDALRSTGQWRELNTLLTSGGIDAAYPKQKLRLWQVEAQIHLHADPAQARQTLSRIFEEAGRGDDLVTTLKAGGLAEQLNQWDLAQACYQAVASKHQHTQEMMLPRIFQMAGYQHDGATMFETCSRMLALKPENLRLLTQKLYLQLLLGIELEMAQLQLQKLPATEAAADADHLHLLHALAAYRRGEIAPIREALDRVAKPESLPAGERAVYAALLKISGGDAGRAFRIAERISPALLLPEEKIFFQRAL
jgi:hypothetical protein